MEGEVVPVTGRGVVLSGDRKELRGVSMNGTKNWDRDRIFRAKQIFRPSA